MEVGRTAPGECSAGVSARRRSPWDYVQPLPLWGQEHTLSPPMWPWEPLSWLIIGHPFLSSWPSVPQPALVAGHCVWPLALRPRGWAETQCLIHQAVMRSCWSQALTFHYGVRRGYSLLCPALGSVKLLLKRVQLPKTASFLRYGRVRVAILVRYQIHMNCPVFLFYDKKYSFGVPQHLEGQPHGSGQRRGSQAHSASTSSDHQDFLLRDNDRVGWSRVIFILLFGTFCILHILLNKHS